MGDEEYDEGEVELSEFIGDLTDEGESEAIDAIADMLAGDESVDLSLN